MIKIIFKNIATGTQILQILITFTSKTKTKRHD